jgi:hypothetical protein
MGIRRLSMGIRLSRANDGTVGGFGREDDLFLMKNDYN